MGRPRSPCSSRASGRSGSRRSPTTSRRGSTPPTSRSRREWMPRSCASSARSCSTAPPPRSRGRSPSAACLEAAAAPPARRGVDDAGALEIVRDPAIAAYFADRPLTSLTTVGAGPRAARRARARRRRRLVRVLPPLRGRATVQGRHGQERHLPHRGQAAPRASPRWASTSSTCRRSIRSGGSTARDATTPSTRSPAIPGRRGRSAPPRAGTTPSTPTSARSPTSAPSCGPPAPRASRSPSTSRCRPPPTTPGSRSIPEWFTTLPDGSIAYAENPPKKYQDIYPVNFDNDPEGIRAEVLRVVRHWIAQGVSIFRVDNPHTKPLQFWEWLIATVNAEHPDVVFLAEAFTRPAPLQSLAAAGFQQSYTLLHVAQHEGRARGVPRRVSHRDGRLRAARTCSSTPPTSSPSTCSSAGARPTGSAPRSPRRRRRPTACTPATSSSRTSRGRGRKRTSTTRSTSTRSATGRAPRRAATRSRRTSRGSTRSAASIPPSGSCATSASHWSDDDAILVYVKHLDAGVSPTGPQRHDHRRRQHRPALGAPDDGAPRHPRLGRRARRAVRGRGPGHRARSGPGPITTSSGSTRSPNPSTSST